VSDTPGGRHVSASRMKNRSTWREDVLQDADRVDSTLRRSDKSGHESLRSVEYSLELAKESATQRRKGWDRFAAWWTGIDIERAWQSLHSAKQDLFFIAPEEDVRAQVPLLKEKVRTQLSAKSAERAQYEAWLKANDETNEVTGHVDRGRARAIRAAVDRESDLRHANIRRFRNTLIRLLLAVVLIDIVLVFDPPSDAWLPICPQSGSCPQVWHVQLAGLVGGLLAAAAALRRIQVTGEPYGMRAFQAALKIPMGALTAVVGTMILQSGVIDALEPQPAPDVLVYCVIFGASQEAVTRFIDKKANSLLEGAGLDDLDQENGGG
jgi:hypothetical protein